MLRLLLFISMTFKLFFVFSQCAIDTSYTAPGIYPDPLPDGYVGQPIFTRYNFHYVHIRYNGSSNTKL